MSLVPWSGTGVEHPAAAESQLRYLRHNLRGRLNALKLCVSALEILANPQEELDFLEMIEQAADGTVAALDELDAHPEQQGLSPGEA